VSCGAAVQITAYGERWGACERRLREGEGGGGAFSAAAGQAARGALDGIKHFCFC
jgi:hypothetical protein